MSAAVHRHAAALLHRAGLIGAVLAIIAGIFGMHVLTGTHAMHSPASTMAAVDTHTTAVSPDHAGHSAEPSTVSEHSASGAQDRRGAAVEQCSESGDCTSMHAMTVACTPSAKTASMAAPPPGTLVLGINNTAATGIGTGQWSYLPDSPSPCELSISRT